MEVTSVTLPIEGLHTVLYCQKWEGCVSFYRDTLGFPVVFANDMFVELQPVAGAFIGLLDAARTTRPLSSFHDTFILSFHVIDVEMTHGVLRQRYEGVSEIKNHPWGARLFEVKDPEGRLLEFWSNAR
jgi:catechol 2,3-dioxygenase-like lactoylglutathione lyase family enzyme